MQTLQLQRQIVRQAGMVTVLGLWLLAAGAVAADDTILKRADDFRNPAESFVMGIEVNDGQRVSEFEVYLKGKDKTLIVTKAPAADRGRNMLMLDRDFHIFIPNLKRSMRLPLAQKLSGQVAYGDIARMRWHGDYEILKQEKEGALLKLHLRGIKENLTYQQMRLWVDAKTAQPQSAEFLSLDGKLVLKTARFEDYGQIAGGLRPRLLRIKDPAGAVSTIRVLSMRPESLSDARFSMRELETRR